MGVVAIAVCVIFLLIWFFRTARKNHHYYEKIPGPPPLFFFGNIFDFGTTDDILNVIHKYAIQYNGLYKVQLGPMKKLILTSNYEILERVLGSMNTLTKSDEYFTLVPWLGTGLLTSDGPKWKKHRKIITPTFHYEILKGFIDIFESKADQLVQKLQDEIGKNSVDIYPFITLCTLDIICEAAMGLSINAQSDNDSEYVKSVKSMCKISIERLFHPLQMNDVTYPLTKNYYIQRKCLNVLHSQTNSIIKKKQQELQNRNNTPKKLAFLDLLLQPSIDGDSLTLEEIREEVDTFMFEGHDTTASAISFALYCLANNIDIQQKAYEEQMYLFGKNKNPIVTSSDLQNMKYLESVIKETLRLYPPVALLGRKTAEPIQCNQNGENILIPEGATIIMLAFAIHRDPKYYKDPEKFDPSRFDNLDGKNPYAYIPFSAGPRNCIGQKYAMLQMKSILSKVLRNYELHPAVPIHTLQIAAESVLISKNGMKIGLSVRQ